MFELKWTIEARAAYNELKQKALDLAAKRKQKDRAKSSPQEGLFKQVSKTLRLLSENPRHPGLQTHEYHSLAHPWQPSGKVFEAYAQNQTPGAYRVFWCYGPDKQHLTVIAITPHP